MSDTIPINNEQPPVPKHDHRFTVAVNTDEMHSNKPGCYFCVVLTAKQKVTVAVDASGRLTVEQEG